ncbi:MAG: hypothetical protein ACE37H_14935 [Phycisphaeraceae bacterium]
MDFEPLEIRDSETRTYGGPPGWMAFSIIFGMITVIAILSFIAGLLI